MKINAAGLLLCTFLVGCGGTAPFGEDTTTDELTDEDGNPIEREGLPPGTASPSPNASLFRSEPTEAEGGNVGDGFATDISYDGETDTFTVDNLAFDGGNDYQRGTAVSSLSDGQYAVYEADSQFLDSFTQDPINQLTHRAIYGVSRNLDDSGQPETEFAIVRTGSYVPYGFGGFIYQRANSVSLPSEGQATFTGQTAGLRDFDNTGGLQYSTSDISISIDFEDFNDVTGARGDGVLGRMSNRRVFNLDGEDITESVVNNINANNNASLVDIPDVLFEIGPGVLDDNGDLIGNVESYYTDLDGAVQEYETGKYYAIVSGEGTDGSGPEEIVGVIVVENTSEIEDSTVRDTSGFIVYRGTGD